MLPRRHRTAAVRHLPEDLTIGLLLDPIGRPVRRLRRGQCRGGRAVALAAGTVAGDAVRLDCLLRVTDALDRILRRLRFRRRHPWSLGRYHRRAGRHDEDDRGRGDAERLLERAHEASSRTIVTIFTKSQPFNTPPTKEVKELFDGFAPRPASRARSQHRRRPPGGSRSSTAAPTARKSPRSEAANG